jgi:hypothetical protein
MEPSITREAISCAATQVFPTILHNKKVYYRFHKSPPLVPILSQTNSVHTIPSCLSKSHLNIFHALHLGLPSGLFPSVFPTNNIQLIPLFPFCATCPAHVILLDLIILIILGE